MAIEHELAAHLAAQAGVTAICSDRIYQDKIPQGELRPALVYRVGGGEKFYHTTGKTTLARSDIQLFFHAKGTPLKARQLYDAVAAVVDGVGNTTWGSTSIDRATLSQPTSATGLDILGGDTGYPAYSATLEVFHR